MLRAVKSELIRLKRPSFLVAGIGLMTLFGALATVISFVGAGTTGAGPASYFPAKEALAASDGLVAGLALGSQLLGIVALALWAIAVATDYQTGLIRLLVQAQPSRIRLLAGKVVALILLTLAGSLAATVAAVGSAYVVAPLLDVSTSAWGEGTVTTLLEAFRNLALATTVWGIVGLTIATLTRSAGVSIAAGIGWVVVFETMLQGVAADLADKMPGAMLTALAAGGTSDIEFGTAMLLATVYTLVGLTIAGLVTRRREITY
jgi:ABC-2 type transport system permease protein